MFDPERATAEMHRELVAIREERPAARHATVVTMIRLAGEVRVDGGRTVIRAEPDSAEAAVRLRRDLADLYGRMDVSEIVGSGAEPHRYAIRITASGTDLAREMGLVDRRGGPVMGLPPAVVAGGPPVAAAVWRGALLARGRLARPSGRTRLQVLCPGPAVALALVGAARGLGAMAMVQETASEHRVVVRDPDSIDAVLRSAGAAGVAGMVRRSADDDRPLPGASPSLQSVNARRAAAAAATATARTRWALGVLGESAPDHLREAGQLRVEHASLSLSQLGRMADPPLSKDAVAGRLRRLVLQAEEHLAET
ncbi:DNA-binding protein WhiA [Pseudonocardia phyllosphaerae]|uniref:DNA-binding protein WhiA n=1 Tax=Pseudonocardia phyllosphaerae TaxID=3390502 RepID=UPI003979E090